MNSSGIFSVICGQGLNLDIHNRADPMTLDVPLHRQEKDWQAMGAEIVKRQILSNWVLKASRDWLIPVVEHMSRIQKKEHYLHMDETPVQVMRQFHTCVVYQRARAKHQRSKMMSGQAIPKLWPHTIAGSTDTCWNISAFGKSTSMEICSL